MEARVPVMALFHSVVCHLCLSAVALANMEIRLAILATAAFLLATVRVPCDSVFGQRRDCGSAPADALAAFVADDRIDDGKFRRRLPRFHRY
jgi:hypothetical protein